jgi:hypothetical protein
MGLKSFFKKLLRNITNSIPANITNSSLARYDTEINALQKIESETSTHMSNQASERSSQHLLTLCTTVRDNVHFIVEWIEFMRLQGVDQFVIYDDRSRDNLTLLEKFYRQRDPGLTLHILKGRKGGKGFGQQFASLQHCLETFRNSTDWMLLSDTDELLYSPSHGTLRAMIEDMPRIERDYGFAADNIYAKCHRFGSSGQRRKFQYRLVEAADGTVHYRTRCGGRDGSPQLMINQVRRGPFPEKESTFRASPPEELRLHKELVAGPACTRVRNVTRGTLWCDSGPGKSLFRAALVAKVAIHEPALFTDGHWCLSSLHVSSPFFTFSLIHLH